MKSKIRKMRKLLLLLLPLVLISCTKDEIVEPSKELVGIELLVSSNIGDTLNLSLTYESNGIQKTESINKIIPVNYNGVVYSKSIYTNDAIKMKMVNNNKFIRSGLLFVFYRKDKPKNNSFFEDKEILIKMPPGNSIDIFEL
jgi:hypothetical protein